MSNQQQYYKGSDGIFYPVKNTSYQQPNAQPVQAPIYKRSGAVYTTIRNKNGGNSQFEGEIIVNAWRSTQNGLMKAVCAPYSGEGKRGLDIVTSNGKSGNTPKEYQKMLCTVSNASLGTSQVYHVLMNLKTKVIVISELSLCITPNGNGTTKKGKRVTGYFGRNFKSN
jgi:hypothetical protein